MIVKRTISGSSMGNRKTTGLLKNKKVIRGLDNVFVLAQLLRIAEELDITVRQERGDFSGGSCRVEETRLIFVKKQDPDSEKIIVLARELVKFDFDDIEIEPTVRDYLNRIREEYNDAVQEEEL
jgi:hypothetical protein